MADDGTKRDSLIEEDSEVEHFAREHGFTLHHVRWLISLYGNRRAALTKVAKAMRKGNGR